jgi:hypothetical protein
MLSPKALVPSCSALIAKSYPHASRQRVFRNRISYSAGSFRRRRPVSSWADRKFVRSGSPHVTIHFGSHLIVFFLISEAHCPIIQSDSCLTSREWRVVTPKPRFLDAPQRRGYLRGVKNLQDLFGESDRASDCGDLGACRPRFFDRRHRFGYMTGPKCSDFGCPRGG